MSDQDIARERRNRLKALRANSAATNEDGTEPEVESVRARAGRRRSGEAAGGARRGGGGGDFRARILSSLKDVQEGEELVEGTEVGRKNLEELMEKLASAEPAGRGKKLEEIVWGLLDPVETEEGLEFSPDGVGKLVAFLERGPAPGRGQGPGGMGRRAGRAQGLRGRGLRGGRRDA